MIKNKKGFTLIEVLVSITIMGIITAIALPEVQQLQATNREKKFETYADSLLSSARLFVDSNFVDLFGNSAIACATITYDNLKAKMLAKDYATNGITCANNDTYVVVNKNGNNYTYDIHLKCTKDGKIEYESKESLTRCDSTNDSSGGVIGDGAEKVDFNVTIPKATDYTKTKQDVSFKITTNSDSGLLKNLQLSYYVSKNAEGTEEIPGSDGVVSFYNNGGSSEKEITKKVDKISVGDYTGDAYLIVEPDNVCILKGCNGKRQAIPVKFDNTGPEITGYEVTISFPNSFKIPHFNISYIEDESGIAYWTYENLNSASSVEKIFSDKVYPYTDKPYRTPGLEKGNKYRIKAYDKAGNVTAFDYEIK